VKVCKVKINENMQKKFSKIPHYIQEIFTYWVGIIEQVALIEMRKINAFRDHPLKGKLEGLRSTSLNRSYRVIYKIINEDNIVIYVIEVNKHDYKIY
jgi:addiction module RelE/StbE family toxin